MSQSDPTAGYDPLAKERNAQPPTSFQVPILAEDILRKDPRNPQKLREILDAAIIHKMTTPKIIGEEFGEKAEAVAKGKRNPDPHIHRQLLHYLRTLEAA